jgi:tetratricopeptide (TPR) repeat protein
MNGRIGFGVALVIFMSASAYAQEQHVDDVQAARDHYAKGKRLYDLGRFAESAKEYEAAYQAKDDPALLFNLGQAYRLAGNYPKALLAYKAYLRNVPTAANRREVEERISEMQAIYDEQERTGQRPPQGTLEPAPLPPEPKPATPQTVPPVTRAEPAAIEYRDAGKSKRLAGIVVTSAGIAIVGGGIGFAVASKDAGDAAYRPSNGVYDFSADDRQKSYRAADIACFVVGGAAIVAGTTLWIFGHRERRTPQRASADGVRF